jgi:hypothetical protein
MKNKPPVLPEELNQALEHHFLGKNPSSEFASNLENRLRARLIEKELNNMPEKSESLRFNRLAWGVGILLIALLFGLVFTSPTIVSAMKRLLGYIPGIGLVEQDSQLRVLAEPISQTRDGITIRITEAVLSADKTVIAFTYENNSVDTPSQPGDITTCPFSSELRLLNGKTLLPNSASGGTGADSRFENRIEYEAVPADVNEAVFVVPCTKDTDRDAPPADWEFPLRFVVGQQDERVVPVMNVTPPVEQSGDSTEQNPLRVEQMIETQESYILIGVINGQKLPMNDTVVGFTDWPAITDADGKTVDYTVAYDVLNDADLHQLEPGALPWAFEILGKQYAWPLMITFSSVNVERSNLKTSFEFDAGPQPQPGQEWAIEKDIQLGEYTLNLSTIQFTGEGYKFAFKNHQDVSRVNVEIEEHRAMAGGGGGGGSGSQGGFEVFLGYDDAFPTGKLTVAISNPVVRITGPWQVEWQPDSP